MEDGISREEKRKRQKKERKKRLRKEMALTQLEATKTEVHHAEGKDPEETEEDCTLGEMESKKVSCVMSSVCELCKECKVRYFCQDCNRCYCEKVLLPCPFQSSAMIQSIECYKPKMYFM